MSIHALFVFLFNISSVHLCTIPLSFCVLFIEHPESVSVIYAAEVNHVKTYNLLVTEPDETGDKNSFIYNAYLYVTTLILIRISKVAQFDDFHF